MITDHAFDPYFWDDTRCGYVDGGDQMCGFPEAEHVQGTDLPKPGSVFGVVYASTLYAIVASLVAYPVGFGWRPF